MAEIVGDDGRNFLQGTGSDDSLRGLAGNDTLEGFAGDDFIDGGVDNDELWGGAGSDTLLGGDGNDRLDAGSDDTPYGRNLLQGGAGDDTLYGYGGDVTLQGGEGNDHLQARGDLNSRGGNDLLQGGAGDDVLMVSDKNRTAVLEGGNGNDTFWPGANRGSIVTISGGSGIDTYRADFDVSGLPGIMRSQDFKAGAGGDRIDLNALRAAANGLVGSEEAFDPALGYLRLVQVGSDTALQFDLDGAAGSIYEWQTVLRLKGVQATALRLADNFVDYGSVTSLAVATGTNAAPTLLAPIADQQIFPNGSFNFNVARSAFGDADVGDQLVLRATLSDGSVLPEWLTFSAWDGKFRGQLPADRPLAPMTVRVTAYDTAGRSVSDTFVLSRSSSGNDSLLGTAGNDTIDGLGGNDTIDGAGGADRLFGGVGDDQLLGSAGGDWLDGGAGSDTMIGGAGNDTFVVGTAGDRVTEAAGGGNDTVRSTITYTLAVNVENLELLGTGKINGTGNASNNSILGNSGANRLSGLTGNDTLNGAAGSDTMIGGFGNDTYHVDNTGDVVTELTNAGTDTLVINRTATLTGSFANIEHLTLAGTAAINGTGNTRANLITGNGAANILTGLAGNDTLNGGAGADRMSGGTGNDTYHVDNTGDVVTELTNAGTDTLVINRTATLSGSFANIEHLTLAGTAAINATGNARANLMTGNAGANALNGASGNDTLIGAGGSDKIITGSGSDTVMLSSKFGIDRLTDYATASDTIRISQATLRIGDGDTTVDAGVMKAGSGGFSAAAEVVEITTDIAGALSTTSAAAMIGSATSAYATGATRLFVVDNAVDTGVFLFRSSGANALVSASELTQLALIDAANTVLGDYLFMT